MALTRANIEVILVKRCQKTMAFVDMAVTYAGTNDDLSDPIGVGIRECSGTVSNFVAVADADVATVDSSDYDKLIDIAEYRLIASMISNFDKYGLKVGPRSGYQSQVREGLSSRLKLLGKELEAKYGWNAPSPEVGVIGLDIAHHRETRY